jgi:V8-like Glu-specific endopeptidase
MKAQITKAALSGRIGQRVVSAASFALLLSACGAPSEADNELDLSASQSSELKNGTLVDSSVRWRGVVSVNVWDTGNNIWLSCSGTITSRRTVVTAAHCVAGQLQSPSGWLRIMVLRENAGHTFDTIMPDSTVFVRYNPAWDGYSKNDVAVIRANSDFTNVTQSDAIPIAKTSPSGSTMWVMGYGYYDVGSTDYDGHLRGGQLAPTFDSFNQDYTFRSTTQATVCRGDSGGPLKMVNGAWMMFGVTSRFTGSGALDKCGPDGHWATTALNYSWLQFAIGYVNCTDAVTGLFCW